VRRRRLLRAIAVILLLATFLPYVLPLPGPTGVAADELATGGRFVEVEGGRLYIELDGPPDGPPIVLLHGLGGSTFSWRTTVPALAAAGWRTAAVDLLGFGLSDKSFDVDHSHAPQARRVAAAMVELGIGPAVMIGHSMGANVVLHLAHMRPDLVERLVLVDASVQTERSALWPGQLLHLPPVARWGRFAVRALATPERVTDILRSTYRDPRRVDEATAAGYLQPLAVRDWDSALLAIMRDAGGNALPAAPATIEAPTLIVWGAHDSWIDLAEGELLRDAMADARLVVIDDAGHLPFEEQPAQFIAEVLPFLAGDR
jgi:pimeloyl-ACP methyl ester carboxylesterase